MRSKLLIIVFLGMVVLFQGCNTLKGAGKGVKEDWKVLTGADDWIKENLW